MLKIYLFQNAEIEEKVMLTNCTDLLNPGELHIITNPFHRLEIIPGQFINMRLVFQIIQGSRIVLILQFYHYH